jgi:hypothetical protein
MQEEDSTINLTALYSQVIIQFEMEFQRENYNLIEILERYLST